MIVAGTLTERVTVLKAVVTRDEFGSQQMVFRDGATVWANVKFQRGAQALTAGEVWMTRSIVVTMRYTKEVGERDRLRWDGKTYRIESLNRAKLDGSVTIVAECIDEDAE